jgi:UDP-N-acetylglucosamine--N-acetylmuramyl-(pentapeptide) pyrophosphoryl-undecaprenol N-acetylglucosamine transferase
MNDSPTSPRQPLSLVFAGGGTGGHLYPGIALAKLFRERLPETHLLFVGSERAIEQQILKQDRFAHTPLPFRSPRTAWKNPWRFWREWRFSLQAARQLLQQSQADVVIGLGGFASYPLLQAALKESVPIVLLEQNVIPGRVTSLFARSAHLVCGSYAKTSRYLPAHISYHHTGNPVRQEVLNLQSEWREQLSRQSESATAPVLLITGGSQGSARLNQRLMKLPREFWQQLAQQGWTVRHQTGKQTQANQSALCEFYAERQLNSQVAEFFPCPESLYQNAVLAITRAGGTTLAELACLQIPSLIIPLADAARNHQFHNAREHLRESPGLMLTDQQAGNPEILDRSLRQLLQKVTLLQATSNAQECHHSGAANTVYEHILNIASPPVVS